MVAQHSRGGFLRIGAIGFFIPYAGYAVRVVFQFGAHFKTVTGIGRPYCGFMNHTKSFIMLLTIFTTIS
jgi:hypothetical protein